MDGIEPCPNEFLSSSEGNVTHETSPDFTLKIDSC